MSSLDLDFDIGLPEPVAAQEVVMPLVDPPGHKSKPSRRGKAPTTRGRGPLYLDIETIPDLSRESCFGLDPLPAVRPENTPDTLMSAQEFCSQSIKEMRQWAENNNPPESWIAGVLDYEQAQSKVRSGVLDLVAEMRKVKTAVTAARLAQLKTMSVTPEFCRIVTIGAAMGASDPTAELALDEDSERQMLESFWSLLASYTGPIVVFNGLRFDLPVIFVRSAMLGVEPTRRLDLRPWGSDVIDLYATRFPPGSSTPMGQKRLTAALQIEDAETDQGDDGSQVYDQFVAGEHHKIVEHVLKDVVRLRGLHAMYQGFFCN